MEKQYGRYASAVKRLRGRLKMSQSVFARAVRVNVRTLQGWEIGRYVPEYADLILEALGARVEKHLQATRKRKRR